MAKSHYSNLQMKRAIKRNEFEEYYFKAAEWVRGHMENVIVGGVVLVLLAVLVPYWIHSRAERADKAGALLFEAQRMFASPARDEGTGYGGWATSAEKYAQVQQRFRDLVGTYSGTDAAVVAELMAAHCDLRLGNWQKALDGYNGFLAKHRKHAMAGQAADGVGQALEGMGKPREAAEAYAKAAAADPQSANWGGLLLAAARVYQSQGMAKEAGAALDTLLAAPQGRVPQALVDAARARQKTLGK